MLIFNRYAFANNIYQFIVIIIDIVTNTNLVEIVFLFRCGWCVFTMLGLHFINDVGQIRLGSMNSML